MRSLKLGRDPLLVPSDRCVRSPEVRLLVGSDPSKKKRYPCSVRKE